MHSLDTAQTLVRFRFRDPSLLLRALTHRSYLNEKPDHGVPHNERLEFLGDAIIGFLVGEYLFQHLPERQEGELTALRAALVRSTALAEFAERIRLGELILMGRGEETSGGRERQSLLADAFEALVAAIYLDQGMEAVREWVEQFTAPAVQPLARGGGSKDARSSLQEIAQAERGLTPRYELVEQSGPDHERLFTIHVRLGDEVSGAGQGRTKQAAAQAAARAALLAAFGIEHS